MNFRVFEMVTGRDVTDEFEWYIDTDGDLRYIDSNIGLPLAMANDRYYYKLEIEII